MQISKIKMRPFEALERYRKNRAGLVRQAEGQLLALLRAGLESGAGIPVTKSYWARKRNALGRSWT